MAIEKNNNKTKVATFASDDEQKIIPSKALLEGRRALDIKELTEVEVEQYLLAHGVVAQGIDKRSNRIINRGYMVKGEHDESVKVCEQLIYNSGGEILLKNWIKDGYGFGKGFLELIYDKEGTEVLRLQQKHPVYFGFLKVKSKGASYFGNDKMVIVWDTEQNQPKGYCEYALKDTERKPINELEVPYNKVAHLKFDTWGDEIEGISIMQYCYLPVKYLMNIEEAGAEAMYRNGFVQKKFKTNLVSKKQLKEFAGTVANVNEKDSIILTKDTNCENLTPGKTDFVPFHQEFMKLLSVPIGIPKPLLLMDGSDTNKATLTEVRKEMYEDSYADELIIKRTIDEQVFARVCEMQFPELKKEQYPRFFFKKRPEDREVMLELKNREADIVAKVSQAAQIMFNVGMEEEAKGLISKTMESLKEENQELGIRALFEQKEIISKSVGTFETKKLEESK